MNYRANIVIFHEIAPLSARSSKKEDAKRGTGAREMAKTDRKTGGLHGCGSCIGFSVRPRTAYLPRCAGAREAGGARGGPHGGTERHNRRAAPALARTTPFRPKKGGANGSGLGHFFDLSGSFSPMASTASAPPRRRKKRGRRNRRKSSLAHTRTTPSFCFSPSPIGSNSVVHNALRVKISHILTQRQHHTTTS